MATLVERDDAVVQSLLDKLRSPDTTLPAKYRILFSLRSIAGPTAHAAMLEGAPQGGPGPGTHAYRLPAAASSQRASLPWPPLLAGTAHPACTPCSVC